MSKAYLTPPKGIRTANGGRMRLGMIIGGTEMQRPLNSSLHPRDGAAKRTQTTFGPAAPDMKRQTKGEPSAYHHGVTVDDEPNTSKTFTAKTPLHPSTTAKQRAAVDSVANDPKAVLSEASNLGRKT